MSIGIIGFGRLGSFLAKHLIKNFPLFIYDQKNYSKKIKSIKANSAPFKEVAQQNIIIICVPISQIEKTLKNLKQYIKPNTLVIDVCSVKQYSVKLMKKYLPANVEILGTHPMFGPDSAKKTLEGSKIVLCKIRINNQKYQKIKKFLNKKKLIVIETSPYNHDKEISKTLFLTHYIGRSLIDLKAKPMLIDTKGYQRLLKILATVEKDTWQLFNDMYQYNSFAPKILKKFHNSLNKVAKRLK